MLSAVGLLPIAVAGIDTDELLAGTLAAEKAFANADINENDSYRYAVIRNILLSKNKNLKYSSDTSPTSRCSASGGSSSSVSQRARTARVSTPHP